MGSKERNPHDSCQGSEEPTCAKRDNTAGSLLQMLPVARCAFAREAKNWDLSSNDFAEVGADHRLGGPQHGGGDGAKPLACDLGPRQDREDPGLPRRSQV